MTRPRGAARAPGRRYGSRNNDAGVRSDLEREPKLDLIAASLSLSLSLSLSSCTIFGGRTPIFPGTAGVVTSSLFFSPSSECEWSGGRRRRSVQYLQMEAAEEEKSSFVREKHIPLVRPPPKPFRADGRAGGR